MTGPVMGGGLLPQAGSGNSYRQYQIPDTGFHTVASYTVDYEWEVWTQQIDIRTTVRPYRE